MEVLYNQTNSLVQEIHRNLTDLENPAHLRSDNAHLVENDVQAKVDQIISNCERLDIIVSKEPNPARRSTAKVRVNQLRYDAQHLQAALRQIQHKRYRVQKERMERDELLSTQFSANSSNASSPYYSSHTSLQMDHDLEHHDKLQSAHRQIDDLLDQGTAIFGNIRSQGSILKSVRTRILNIANTLGLSNTVMRLIEKRSNQDRIIMIVCMIVTFILMFIIYRIFH